MAAAREAARARARGGGRGGGGRARRPRRARPLRAGGARQAPRGAPAGADSANAATPAGAGGADGGAASLPELEVARVPAGAPAGMVMVPVAQEVPGGDGAPEAGGSTMCGPGEDNCLPEDGGTVVRDDLDALLGVLPESIREPLVRHPLRTSLLEVVLDLGRKPEARFLGVDGGEFLSEHEITAADLEAAEAAVGEFGSDNRAGVTGTLHRISALRSRRGALVGLTCRVGRAVTGHVDMIRDMLAQNESILFLGAPGVGKTTVIREMARVLADLSKRVVIVDTSNEIGGDGDVPHPAIGRARRMQVPDPAAQQHVMVEAVQNHMPECIVVDEVGTQEEALACRTIAERGVQLVATAHGQVLENVLKNPTLTELVGGVAPVTLSDDEARARGTQKTILERKGPVTFTVVIEMRERNHWIVHRPSDDSVDMLLCGKRPIVESRTRSENGEIFSQEVPYDNGEPAEESAPAGADPRYSWADQLSDVSERDALSELARAGYLGGRGGPAGMGTGKRGGRR